MSTVVKDLGAVSAYAYAVEKGYTGTEAEFAELMADYAEVGQRAEDAADRAEAALDEFTSVTADATTLPEGSSATAEYSDGHLTLGIPKGDKGDTGAKGDGAVYAVIGNMASVIPAGTDGYLERAYTITIPVTFYSGKDNVTGSVTSSDLYISRTSGGSGEMDTVPGSTYRNVKTATIIYAIPAGWKVGNGRITLTVTIGTATLTYYHAYTTAPTGPQGEQGIQGPIGATPNLTIGTVTTLQPTAPATATISGTADNPVLSFGIPKGDTGEVSQEQFDAALALKADAIGNYPELAVGTAEQIDSDTVVAEDVAPYQFRQSISGASNRAYDKIVGGSLAVNQLVPDLGTLTSSGSKAFNNGTAKIAGHKYLFSANISADGNTVGLYSKTDDVGTTEIILYYSAQSAIISAKKTATSAGTNNNSNGNMWLYPFIPNGSISNIMFIDITAMFGSTIADYVYGLETATAGAGVEWLKSHFPKIFDSGYIPYNAGTLEHVSGLSAHKMVGFNCLNPTRYKINDGTNYNQSIGTTLHTTGDATTASVSGENPIKVTSVSGWRGALFYTPVLANNQYQLTCGISASTLANVRMTTYFVDENFVVLKKIDNYSGVSSISKKITLDNNCYFALAVESTNANDVTYLSDPCLHLVWDGERDGEYEPYEEHSYPLDSDVTLRGLPKLDADNNLVYDGDVYESTGKVTRKYGIVDLGTLNFSHDESNGRQRFTAYVTGLVTNNGNTNLVFAGICTKYRSVSVGATWVNGDISWYDNNINAITIIDNAYTDAATFKTAMSGVYLVYELATPTTETAQPFTNPQVVDASGTEEYVTDSVVPVGHVTKYVENLKAKLESAPASPAEDGDYIVRQTDGVNEYVPLNSAPAITAKADVSELLKAFPTDTASGSVASFADGANVPVKSLIVDINPVQSGSGDPSPDNVRPISGWSEVNVGVSGKNLFNNTGTTQTINDVTFTVNSDGTVSCSGTATATAVFRVYLTNSDFPQNETLILNGCPSGGSFTSKYGQALCDSLGATLGGTTDDGTGATYSAANLENLSQYQIVVRPGINANGLVFKPMLRLVSESDATFEPYQPIQSVNISLGQTVYSGTLDVTKGELVIDMAMVDLGTLTWSYASGMFAAYIDGFKDKAKGSTGIIPNAICSAYKASTLANVYGSGDGIFSLGTTSNYAGRTLFKDSRYTDATAFKAVVTGQTLVYELATPITVTLTPNELSTLLGANNIWSDAGEVTAEYRADPTLFIQRKIAEALS